MKKNIYFILITIFLLAGTMYASHAEHFKVKAKIVKTLSAQETKIILKKYNTKQKYNIGIQIKVISCVVQEGSYVKTKYKQGEILNIVVSTNNKKLVKKIKKNNRIMLKYDYSDDERADGLHTETSWTVIQ